MIALHVEGWRILARGEGRRIDHAEPEALRARSCALEVTPGILRDEGVIAVGEAVQAQVVFRPA